MATIKGPPMQVGQDAGSPFPPKIFAHALTRPSSGASFLDPSFRARPARPAWVRPVGARPYFSTPPLSRGAAGMLKAAGFDVFMVHPLSIGFAGTRETFEKAFRTTLVTVERRVIKPLKGPDTATFIDDPATDWFGFISTENTPFRDVIEGIAIEVPRYDSAASPMPLDAGFYHLKPPHDIALRCNAHLLHQVGISGRGVRVAMVDTGYYAHPYYVARGYKIATALLGYGEINQEDDETGHGTAELANIVSIAPEAEVQPIKALNFNRIEAFQAAVDLFPHIITCSWGSESGFYLKYGLIDELLAHYVSEAISNGITVIFAAGNGDPLFPSQMPEVISVGGVFVDEAGGMQVSNFSTAFASEIYPYRHVPDISGLVGLLPDAAYIVLPVQPMCKYDNYPDGTAPDDGWTVISGTSAAAPQVAGVVALMKQVAPQLWPWEVKVCLQASATPVVDGRSHPVAVLDVANLPVAYLNFGLSGWEGGAGAGLVNAAYAVYLAALHS